MKIRCGVRRMSPAVHPALVDREHDIETLPQRGLDRIAFAAARGRAGAEQDRRAGKDQGRILDEHRVGKSFERRQPVDREAAASSAAT